MRAGPTRRAAEDGRRRGPGPSRSNRVGQPNGSSNRSAEKARAKRGRRGTFGVPERGREKGGAATRARLHAGRGQGGPSGGEARAGRRAKPGPGAQKRGPGRPAGRPGCVEARGRPYAAGQHGLLPADVRRARAGAAGGHAAPRAQARDARGAAGSPAMPPSAAGATEGGGGRTGRWRPAALARSRTAAGPRGAGPARIAAWGSRPLRSAGPRGAGPARPARKPPRRLSPAPEDGACGPAEQPTSRGPPAARRPRPTGRQAHPCAMAKPAPPGRWARDRVLRATRSPGRLSSWNPAGPPDARAWKAGRSHHRARPPCAVRSGIAAALCVGPGRGAVRGCPQGAGAAPRTAKPAPPAGRERRPPSARR